MLVPIDNSILYVRSLYVRGDNSGTPELRRVIASYQTTGGDNKIEVAETLQGALQKLFPGATLPSTLEAGSTDSGSTGTGSGSGGTGSTQQPPVSGTVSEQEDALIVRIITDLDQADALARKGDSVGSAQKVKSAQDASNALKVLRSKPASSPSGSGSTTTTTTQPPTTTGTPA